MASTSQIKQVRTKSPTNYKATDIEIELIKSEFNKKLQAHFLLTRTIEDSPKMTKLWSNDCLDPLILKIQKEKEKSNQDGTFFYRFEDKLLTVDIGKEVDRLLLQDEDGKFKVILPWEDIFDIFWEIHVRYCHPDAETMQHILRDDYIVNDYAVRSIYEVCNTCCKDIKDKPYFRCSLDITTLNVEADFAFSHIMIYQDMCTGYIHLRPLSTDYMDTEICEELLTIFMDFGPPKEVIITNDIFRVALDQFNALTKSTPIPIKVTRVNRHANKYKCNAIRREILEWMKRNEFENWSIACYGVQAYLNNRSRNCDEKSPYDMIFKNIENYSVEDFNAVEFDKINFDKVDEDVRVFAAPVEPNVASVEPSITCDEEMNPDATSSEEEMNPDATSSEEEMNPDATSSEEEIINDEFAGTDKFEDEIEQVELEDPLAIDSDMDL